MSELRHQAKDPAGAARALTIAAEAIQDDQPDVALPYLEWAKSVAPRSPAIREALGVARYLNEDWNEALQELQAYRRLTGRNDQNHLIADSLRALGRPVARVAELVREMDPERDGIDRLAEATIVWASALADAGDPGAGRAVLRRVLAQVSPSSEAASSAAASSGAAFSEPPDHELRLWYVAGDLAERDGDTNAAGRWFRRLADIDPELYDVGERLAKLRTQ